MRFYKTRFAARLAERAAIDDAALREAAERAEMGLIDAVLGRFLIKQRIARTNRGRSGGFRTVLFFRENDKAVFLYLFAKNEKGNLTGRELEAYRELAGTIATMRPSDVATAVAHRTWIEIGHEEPEISK